ncbi:hypothetical protein AMTR_s00151p00073080 [Amborella trichopoda]|uniref:Uncharacterized protein n=1 Tax=Amborella trichopoda TaxID=13333 RepID=W1NJV0_AMBTC|nr:hypothetical protein AMTR_s00151p00073080 [Amborella trichopoda]
MASKVMNEGVLAASLAPCGLQGEGVRAGSPAKHDLMKLMAGGEDLMLSEAPPKVVDYVEACPLLTLCFPLGKHSKLSPFQHHVKEAVALDSYTRLWMYPLFRRSFTRKGCSSQRPAFEPLMVDLLALVVLDKEVEGLNVEDGDLLPVHDELDDLLWRRLKCSLSRWCTMTMRKLDLMRGVLMSLVRLWSKWMSPHPSM